MIDSLLIEILTEELPPKSLERLSRAFSRNVFDGLKEQGFLTAHSEPQPYATPRRLAVLVSNVLARQPDRIVERKGPSVSASFDDASKPTPALLGFARSCGVKIDKLTISLGAKLDGRRPPGGGAPGTARIKKHTGDKGEYFVYRARRKGEPLKSHLAVIVEAGLKKLPVPKLMRWGSGEVQFVRPVHGLVMLHGARVVPGLVLGLKSGKTTQGHRFMSKGQINIYRADQYKKILRQSGNVIADFQERRAEIESQAVKKAKQLKQGSYVLLKEGEHIPVPPKEDETDLRLYAAEQIVRRNYDTLLDEVTALVEWPVVYIGHFDPQFLDVPIQCLALSMQQHQRYFPLVHPHTDHKLLPNFLIVSNIEPNRPEKIIHGNERVLKARLSDAKFFFEQDKKTKLEDHVLKLSSVVFHNKLGSQLERVKRIQKLAGEIAEKLEVDVETKNLVERAAYLCKADLLTEMVGEFPELQGAMGFYYALHENPQDLDVAKAIARHYLPRFAGDKLPTLPADICLALADKLDTLVGIYGIGLVPSGDKDPFGLRRQALGVVRILIEKSVPLDVVELLQQTQAAFHADLLAENVVQNLYGFILDRLKPYLREEGFLPDEIEAVVSLNPRRLDQVLPRLQALQKFRKLPQAEALAAANKRIRNILRQAGGAASEQVDETLLKEKAERELARQVQAQYAEATPLLAAGDYARVLERLAGLRPAVDEFFDRVMVMVDDVSVRDNRLALLDRLRRLFMQVADISRLQS